MWFRFIKCALFALAVVSLATNLSSQDLTPSQKRIFQKAMIINVSQDLHGQFWDSLSSLQRAELKNENSEIWRLLAQASEWQYAVWDSVLQSIQAGAVIRTEEYKRYYKILEKNAYNAKSISNAEMLLRRSHSGLPIDIGQEKAASLGLSSSQIILNEETSRFIRDNTGQLQDRIKVLVKPDWPPKQNLYDYHDQKLRYVGAVRLAFQELDSGINGVKHFISQQNVSRNSSLELMTTDWSKLGAEMSYAPANISAFEDSFGTELKEFSAMEWHNINLKIYDGRTKLDGDNIFIVVGLANNLLNKFAYAFVVWSDESKLTALSLMDDVLNRSSILK
jgi:hypothetical protein